MKKNEKMYYGGTLSEPYRGVGVNNNLAYLFIKRIIDIIGALTGIIVLSPILLLIAIIIALVFQR